MSWLSALVGDREAEAPREVSRFRLGQLAEGKTQEVELCLRGGVEEVALVAVTLACAIERTARRGRSGRDIVAGRHGIGAEVPGRFQEVGELDVLIAADAGDRRLARDVSVGERRDDLFAETAFVVEHVMRDPELRRDGSCVVDVAPGAAGSLARGRGGRAGVVELQRDPDDVVAVARQQGCHDGGIHAARHRDDDPRRCRVLRKSERVQGGCVIHRQQWRETGGHDPCSNAFAGALPALGLAWALVAEPDDFARSAEEERAASLAQAYGLGSFFRPWPQS